MAEQVHVLFFAVARERAGTSELVLDWRVGMTIEGLRTALTERFPELVAVMPFVRFAVNERFVYEEQHMISAGDTVALIPPVSGGIASDLVVFTRDALCPREVEDRVKGPDCGALVTFTGTVRNHTGEFGVVALEYETYQVMAQRVFIELIAEIRLAYPAVRLAVAHRIGRLVVGESAVVIAAASPHRADAFDAAQQFIERLKEDVPIFKKEERGDGSVWVGMGS